ncbi:MULTISPECIES: N-acetylmuramoyl-L-alanine amidase CwlD [unclassified Sporolactobacillus]|uniref:N-acetylmuramoyl-L-alanine amidase CwlD n=1 Tax=unclassified Sporolactobacillus TaxID=2628533 RepID=UPI0023685381|nr:N-acetylmuramoyl-L-alanine amidase CwlD [Sporolactobacillus sp. CQH2019]MDD9150564.1 N-acetylmuramoyl-L-alanine amidase CwlD [Sporolactobacillus sp. CQH2019]
MIRKWLLGLFAVVTVFAAIAAVRWAIVSRHTSMPWHLPLSGRVIVVDAGHGGADGGAVGGQTEEKKITLAIADDLRHYLQESGALVVMTRESDKDLADADFSGRRKTQDLLRRADLIKKTHPDVFISIHLNAIPSPQWHGAQTFYYPSSEENRKLALFIQNSLKINLGNTDRYAKPIGHVYLLKKAAPPAALVEVGFLSNPGERALLVETNYQKQAAAAISQGIMRYFTNEKVPQN